MPAGGIGNVTTQTVAILGGVMRWSFPSRWFRPLSTNVLLIEVQNPARQCLVDIVPVPKYNYGAMEQDLEPIVFDVRGEHV
jgi:hypothetical protein